MFPRICAGCGRAGSVLCDRCVPPPADAVRIDCGAFGVTALAAYAGPIRTIILRMKGGERDAAAALGALLAGRLGACAIVPVPTTRARIRERGFDQTKLILACAARQNAGLRVHAWLEKRPGAPQHGRARTARLTVRGRFRLCPTARPAGSVVLFDDVMTTGASLADAAATVAEAGVRVSGGIVIARAAPYAGTSSMRRRSWSA